MRLLVLLCLITGAKSCWFVSKENTLKKIIKHLGGRTYIDRAYVHEMETTMPKIISWAIEQIGVDSAFEDCDADKDGKITIDEMRATATCLTSCTKLSILNTVL